MTLSLPDGHSSDIQAWQGLSSRGPTSLGMTGPWRSLGGPTQRQGLSETSAQRSEPGSLPGFVVYCGEVLPLKCPHTSLGSQTQTQLRPPNDQTGKGPICPAHRMTRDTGPKWEPHLRPLQSGPPTAPSLPDSHLASRTGRSGAPCIFTFLSCWNFLNTYHVL